MINVDELRQILDLVRDHELGEFELEAEGSSCGSERAARCRCSRPPWPPRSSPRPPRRRARRRPRPWPCPRIEHDVDVELAIVTSPIVGTFYRAPEPNAPPFVRPGDQVKPGQTLCIIEAMKMMNNIDSEYEGTVVKVFVENGQPVQFGERLFAIKR